MKKTLLFAGTLCVAALSMQAQRKDNVAQHSQYLNKVLEYKPAPGQFVNTMPAYEQGDDAQTMAQKCTELLAGKTGSLITLGAWGGSVTFTFDHSIANQPNQPDLYIAGNAFQNNAEPGIVMVSKDVNKNGIADDPWYELAGSVETDKPQQATYNYSVTYTPAPGADIPWTDNQGNHGTVARNNYHTQEYFPQWITGELTFSGTRLPDIGTQDPQSGYWVLPALSWGYADNLPNSDTQGCSFDFGNAVDAQRNKVDIDFVDFVRVYTGVQQMAGWLGEVSTEFGGAYDLHLQQSLEAIDQAAAANTATFEQTGMTLNADGYYSGDTNGQPFSNYGAQAYKCTYQDAGFTFTVNYTPEWNSWSGVALSNRQDTQFANLATDQYNAVTGKGVDNSSTYAVVFSMGERIEVNNAPQGKVVSGAYFTLNAYTLNAILHGDGMSVDEHGNSTGNQGFTTGDWLKLDIVGHHADGTTSTREFYLADYRMADAAQHYYIGGWQWVDLTDLGAVTAISFNMSSSRTNEWGMTTPAYFCMDNLNGQPNGQSGVVTGVAATPATHRNTQEVARFNANGQRIFAPVKGLNIVKYADGSVRKIMIQ